jgi:hypothetical protein
MAKDKSDWDLTADDDKDRIGGGPGAADAYSGAGNATGIPDADTGMNAEDLINTGDIDDDRAKLFPESQSQQPNPGAQAADEDVDHTE